MRSIILAETAGFCFGVSRSVKMAEKLLKEHNPCYSYGELIHNDDVVRLLDEKGLHVVESIDDLPDCSPVVVRSHGISQKEYQLLNDKECVLTDATCPKVKKIHGIVHEATENGRFVLIVGVHGHPEVRAIEGWCGEHAVVSDSGELEQLLGDKPELTAAALTVVSQTTQTHENFIECTNILKNICTNSENFDTICDATFARQEEAKKLASECDAMVVIGGKHSANSVHLSKICTEHCENVQFISNANELNLEALRTATTVGVTAGASAPAWIIKEVISTMSEEIKAEQIPEAEVAAEEVASEAVEEVVEEVKEEVAEVEDVVEEPEEAPAAVEEPVAEAKDSGEKELTFDEMLEESLSTTIRNGDLVSGVVAAISPMEVNVDLGIKYSGFIPTTEFTDNGDNIEDAVKVGDTIEAIVTRVNDVEGTVTLSKKRLDAAKSWSVIEAAQESGEVVEGTVTEVNKGGVVVNVKGARVFVPASQSGQPREADLSGMVGSTARLVVTEVNKGRKRVVGSIRKVMQTERKAAAEAIWNDIEEGKKYHGVVKSMTSYGAFVDIGGIDGMVHVSELSWQRVKQPSDVLNIGDEVDVYVIGFDKEKRRISLGYKDPDANPWKIFTETYQVGDIAKVKIVKLMPFGAFAEVVPGVDGLIHISQIANHRIGKPEEVLEVGQEVDAKVTAIDDDKQKISLSIRALAEPEPAEAPVEAEAEEEVVYDTSVDVPVEEDEEAPAAEEVVEEAVEAPVEEVVEEAVEAPVEEVVEEAVEAPVEKTVEEAVEAPAEEAAVSEEETQE